MCVRTHCAIFGTMRFWPLVLLCYVFFSMPILLLGQSLQKVMDLSEEEPFRKGNIAQIAVDSDDNLWIVYFGILQRYNGKQSYYINGVGVNSSYFLRFYEKENGEKLVIDKLNQVFYIQADTLVASKRNDTLRALSKGEFCSDFYFDKADRLHIAIPGNDYYIVDTNLQVNRPLEGKKLNGLVCMLRSDGLPFTMKMVDRENPEAEQFFYLLNEKGDVLNKHPMDNFIMQHPNDIVQLSNGEYLVTSGCGHLFEFNSNGAIQLISYHDLPIGLTKDASGGLWISSLTGIDYYKEGRIDSAKRERILDSTFSIPTAGDFQGGVWIGSQEGMHRIITPLFSTFSKANGLIEEDFNVGALVNDTLVYGLSISSLYKLNFQDLISKNETTELEPSALISIKYDTLCKRLWVSERGKLYYQHKGVWKEHSFSKRGSSAKYYFNREIAHDSITVAGYTSRWYFTGRDTSLTFSEPFDEDVAHVVVVGDSVYVGTEGGLYLDAFGERTALYKKYPMLKGTSTSMAYFDQRVWISVNGKGLFVLDGENLTEVKFGAYAIDYAVLIRESATRLWAINVFGSYLISSNPKEEGSRQHVEMFNPIPAHNASFVGASKTSMFWKLPGEEVLKMNFDDLCVYPCKTLSPNITDFMVNGVQRVLKNELYVLKPEENSLYIRYSAASFLWNRVNYRYRLKGLNDSWTVSKENYLQLLGLSSGNYTLELQAQVAYQPWSRSKEVEFTILAPFWKRWWFIALVALAALVSIYALVSYRIRIADKEKKLIVERLLADQKALKAQLNPHFIFNAMNAVQYFIRSKRNREAETYVGLFADLTRRVLENSEKRLVSFTDEMQLYSAQVRLQSMVLPNNESIDLVFDIESVDADHVFMPPALLQPYIENALWHGLRRKKGEKRIDIRLSKKETFIEIRVLDNGIGRAAAKALKPSGKSVKSFGMSISAQRINALNEFAGSEHEVKIKDVTNDDGEVKGTEIILKIPHITLDEITNS